MPRFNAKRALARGYGLEWYDTDRTITQNCDGGHCRIELSDGTLMRDIATNAISACECRFWAAWVEQGGAAGVLDQDGRFWPGAGLGPMGPDGAYALKVLRNSYGPWDVIERHASPWRLTEGDASAIQLLGQGCAIWVEHGALHATQGFVVPHAPTTGPGTWGWPRLDPRDGAHGLLYQSYAHGCLVFDGKQLVDGTAFYRPDVVVTETGVLVAWATDEGEGHIEIASWTFAALAALPDVDTPIVPPLPPPPPIVVPPPPQPIPPPVKEPPVPVKTNDQVRADIQELNRFYTSPDGLNRSEAPIVVRDDAFWDWVAMAAGGTPIEQVKARIRTFPEWKAAHPGEAPP